MTHVTIINEKMIAANFRTELTDTMFGFSNDAKGVWHWFNICSDGSILFNHSYSQNTGKTKKTITHRFKVYDTIKRVTGLSHI